MASLSDVLPVEIQDRKDYVHKVVESGLWSYHWAVVCLLDRLTDEQIDEMLTSENIPLDISFYREPVDETQLVAKHPNVKEGYTRSE